MKGKINLRQRKRSKILYLTKVVGKQATELGEGVKGEGEEKVFPVAVVVVDVVPVIIVVCDISFAAVSSG